MFDKLKKLFKSKPGQPSLEEIYLGQSGTLAELERRQKEIDRGQAPWQIKFR